MGRKEYIRNAAIQTVATLFLAIAVNFVLFRIIPGDPFRILFSDPRIPKEMVEQMIREFGLDQPLHVQFFVYVINLFKGNLGTSFVYRAPVAEILMSRILNSVILIGVSCLAAIIIGILLGALAAWKRGSKTDTFLMSFCLGTYSLPMFWFAMLMITVFAVQLHIFPTSGMFSYGAKFSGPFDFLFDALWHFALPFMTLTIVWLGTFAITMRSSMIDVLTEDYMVTAKAKGLSNFEMIKNHAIKNALLPVVTVITINLSLIVAGAVQTETVFAWPGVGRLLYESLIRRDYPILQGAFLVVTISVLVVNFITDILYSYLDPRVRM